LEFNASVGFIHMEYVTMHGHTIVKKSRIFSSVFQTFIHLNLSNCHQHASDHLPCQL